MYISSVHSLYSYGNNKPGKEYKIMRKFNQRVIVVLILMSAQNVFGKSNWHRSRRFLTFPPTSPTRVQIISGIGIPVDLELESVTIGYVFKAEFFLPENASNYLNFLADPFDLTTRPITGRKRREIEAPTEIPTNAVEEYHGYDKEQNEKYERHQVEAEVVESGTEPSDDDNYDDNNNQMSDEELWFQDDKYDKSNDPMALKHPQNLATSRWTVYKGMAALAESKGLSGKSCVLRSICESAHTPFDYSNGILGELMHIIMSPSTTHDDVSEHSDYEYYRAEKLGKEGAPCEQVFKECNISILNQFSGVYEPMMDLFSKIMS